MKRSEASALIARAKAVKAARDTAQNRVTALMGKVGAADESALEGALDKLKSKAADMDGIAAVARGMGSLVYGVLPDSLKTVLNKYRV